jgi:hypothetical protein
VAPTVCPLYTWSKTVGHKDDVVGVIIHRYGAQLVHGGVDVVLVDPTLPRLHIFQSIHTVANNIVTSLRKR